MNEYWRYLLIYSAINLLALCIVLVPPAFFSLPGDRLGWMAFAGLAFFIALLFQMDRSYKYMGQRKNRVKGQGWATAILLTMLIGLGVCSQFY